MISETLTNGWVKLLAPTFCTLVIGSPREKVGDFVPLASVPLYSLDELNIFGVCPTTYTRAVLENYPTLT